MKKQMKQDATDANQYQLVFARPYKVKRASNGNFLVFVTPLLAYSFHPNFLKAVLDGVKKARQ